MKNNHGIKESTNVTVLIVCLCTHTWQLQLLLLLVKLLYTQHDRHHWFVQMLKMTYVYVNSLSQKQRQNQCEVVLIA